MACIVDTGEIDNIPYVAFEDFEGVTVKHFAKQEGKVPPPVACAIIRQVAIGLHHIHENGLIHSGVSPESIMIDKSGVAKILSVGMCAIHANSVGAQEPTNCFLAPEQIQGKAEERSDIYALGCTLFYMLTGQAPPAAIQRSKEDAELEFVDKNISAQLAAVVRAMIDLDPEKRMQQLTQVVGAMCNWASEEHLPKLIATHLKPRNTPQPSSPPPPKKKPMIDKQAAEEANPKDAEITPPSVAQQVGPAVAGLAVALAAMYGGFLYLTQYGSGTKQVVINRTRPTADKTAPPLRTKDVMPTRAASDSSNPATPNISTLPTENEPTPPTDQDTTNDLSDPSNADKTKPISSDAPTTDSEVQATKDENPPIDNGKQPERTAESAHSTRNETVTIPTAVEVRTKDKSVDAYHRRLAKQLENEYGLTDGQWVLTPNEFALISSVVSYGQKVTQDETSDKEDFARLVRMHISEQGKNPWSSGLYIPEVQGIEKGDRVLVVVWLRTSPGSRVNEGKVGIYVESASDHTKEVYLTVKPSTEWRQFLIPFQAKIEQDLRVGFHLAFKEQAIDYGGLTLINFGKTAPFWNAIPAGPKRRANAK